ncbi:MAG: hypothetical protein PHS50_15305 [Kiritimatiellae bacterium]|nr:hypothetical protein [Kiritimatiellia bacterium]
MERLRVRVGWCAAVFGCAFVGLALGSQPGAAKAPVGVTAAQYDAMTNRLGQAWARTLAVYYYPKTHLFYATPPARVTPASAFTNGRLDPDTSKVGYGAGMEDCDIFGGLVLSMLADQYEVTRDASLAVWAHNTFLGLKLCATVHGVPGFVARGVCVEDGKGICITSSRDQYTHFVHGLWRYYHSPLCDEPTRAEIRGLLRDVAERMIRNVTPENNYDFLRADGSRDPRGICRMWNVHPHEAARLPMLYAAAWDVCRDEKYLRLYREYAAPAVEQSLMLPALSIAKIRAIMPTYTLLQMQTSLELMLAVETDAGLKAKIVAAMQPVAKMAAERAIRINGGEEKYLCACGESALAQLMAKDFAFDERQKALLYKSVMDSDAARVGACRTIHLTAAFWRARRLGILMRP